MFTKYSHKKAASECGIWYNTIVMIQGREPCANTACKRKGYIMKRYGEKATIQALQNGHRIRFNEWFTLNAGYRIINSNDEMIGYITHDLFIKLLIGRIIKQSGSGYSYTEYRLNEFQA